MTQLEFDITRIDFENTKPYLDNGTCKWYVDQELNRYIQKQQDFNLPKLNGYFCFVVKGDEENYVLINDRQQVITDYVYSFEGYGLMQAYINMLKIAKYFSNEI